MEPLDSGARTAALERILNGLKELRLTFIMADLKERMEDPNFESRDPVLLADEIITAECDRRTSQRFQQQLKKADLKYPGAALDEALKDPDRHVDTKLLDELSQCHWLDEARNVIITGMTGAGKTHVACALAVCAITRHRTACYKKAGAFLRELTAAESDETLEALLTALKKVDLLIIDDFGLHKIDINACRNLFELIEARDSTKPTMVVSQIPVKEWYDLFANATYAEAVLDRLIARAYRIEMNGASMRRRIQ